MNSTSKINYLLNIYCPYFAIALILHLEGILFSIPSLCIFLLFYYTQRVSFMSGYNYLNYVNSPDHEENELDSEISKEFQSLVDYVDKNLKDDGIDIDCMDDKSVHEKVKEILENAESENYNKKNKSK